jgi:ATP-dependent helicase/nuclease subunit A
VSGPPDPQRIAADPAISAFVTANAGSGKTKTLIDRVARLLLNKTKPEAVLCVTYTKAAAAEMQSRLFQRLGKWSVTADADLRKELSDLVGEPDAVFDAEKLSEARALFAQALETPGGLKIQTIHAFCEKLLRRFPLEAGVSPGFVVMDDSAGAAVARAARRTVATYVDTHDDPFAEAYARFSVALDFAAFESMFGTFEIRRGAIADHMDRHGGLSGAIEDVWRVCGFDAPTDPDVVAAEAMDELDPDLWEACASLLESSGKARDTEHAARLRVALASRDFDDALCALFTDKEDPRKHLQTTTTFKSREDLREALLEETDRLSFVRQQVRAAGVAHDTAGALRLAALYISAHANEKASRGALDFADLIERTRVLLTQKVDAAWVLYKLDGGVDHILLDEAQDTAPDQWAILRALTDDFFVGAGATGWRKGRDNRTMFVVGDQKQSIYSFQGADPSRLLIETQNYIAKIAAAEREGSAVRLLVSYRSTREVLSFVDTLFGAPENSVGLMPTGGDLEPHTPFRIDGPGCVDLWPLTRERPGEERDAWEAPLDAETEHGANRRLAESIAAEIKGILDRGDEVHDKETKTRRAAHAGDILILVRRRKVLFEEIIRALKRRGVPVAGADRLSLSAHIAFDDLLALGRFVLFPDDDLTLAALLKSPFCGLADEDVYALAKDRKPLTLWATLSNRADEDPRWTAAHDLLAWALVEGRKRQPFEFFAALLGKVDDAGLSNRAKVLTRLGGEADEALDEFLAQVMDAEQRNIRDLEALVADFAALDIIVKREMEGARREVRVMTAHGSKGLEAPIVFLPETTVKRGAGGSPLLTTQDGGVLWSTGKSSDCAASTAARELRDRKEAEEALRLYYVALTRARDRLVLCGRIDARTKDENVGGWYAAAKAAFAHADIAPDVREIGDPDAPILRYGPDPKALPREAEALAVSTPLAAWAIGLAKPEPATARYAAPSRIEDEADSRAPAPSPLAKVEGLGRYRRGEIIHRLLQILPDIAPTERRAAGMRLLAVERELSDDQRLEMAAAAFGVLEDERFAAVFGPGSRAEVALAGTSPLLPKGLAISGRVDRLVVTEGRVLVVDYKTNRPAPATIEDADQAYLAQMAVYVAVLREVFPDRPVEAALVWTDGPKLMPVPEKVMSDALRRIG